MAFTRQCVSMQVSSSYPTSPRLTSDNTANVNTHILYTCTYLQLIYTYMNLINASEHVYAC